MEGELDEEESKRSKSTNPSLPDELITEILVRLPVKYLLQYKCVSKYWLALISSPEFVKTHLSFSAKDYTRHTFLLKKHSNWYALKQCSVSSLFNESVTESFDLDYPMKPKLISRIVGSVNGLICLCFGVKRNGLVLWNPSLRMFKQIPGPVMNAKTTGAMYGFGYDEVHDDYKIVGIFYNLKSVYVNKKLSDISKIYIEAKIYSLRTGSWRSLDDFTGRGDIPFWGKYAKGKLYWVTCGSPAGRRWSIISVDLVDEKCETVVQPCYGKGYFSLNLGVLGSDLSVVCNHLREYRITHSSDVWVMKEYGVKESWTKLYTKCPDDPFSLSTPIYMSNKGEILLLSRSNLTLYNPEDDSSRHPEITDVDGRLEVELHIESLVCPILQTEPMMQFESNKKSR